MDRFWGSGRHSHRWWLVVLAALAYACGAPSVSFDGREYECVEGVSGRWNCESALDSIYCSGTSEPFDCSRLWYPDELGRVEVTKFEGSTYACERLGNRCLLYTGGPPPASFHNPDLWCSGSVCTPYDPDEYFEMSFEWLDYACKRSSGSGSLLGDPQYDCIRWQEYSDVADFSFGADLYCSGFTVDLDCSKLWYPDELSRYRVVNRFGSDYLCRDARTGRHGDLDCDLYSGGDPGRARRLLPDLKCSENSYGLECDPNDYPSFLEGLFYTTIGWWQHVCIPTAMGSECWLSPSRGSVESAMLSSPNYYCNSRGECGQWGYPVGQP